MKSLICNNYGSEKSVSFLILKQYKSKEPGAMTKGIVSLEVEASMYKQVLRLMYKVYPINVHVYNEIL